MFWVKGGNTFFLRKAMQLSGFDKIFIKLSKKKNLLYGGSSAGICVLCPSLKGVELVDDAKIKPYGKKIEWSGLNIITYYFAPHYKSKNIETKRIDKMVAYYIENKKLFKTLKDGQTTIIKNGIEKLI